MGPVRLTAFMQYNLVCEDAKWRQFQSRLLFSADWGKPPLLDFSGGTHGSTSRDTTVQWNRNRKI